MSYCVDNIGCYLEGTWSLFRQVSISKKAFRDTRVFQGAESAKGSEPQVKMVGKAVLSRDSYGLDYREEGRLSQESYQGSFQQFYSLTLDSQKPERAQVFFPDERPFFALDLSQGRQSVEHLCGDDLYRATLLSFEDSIECEWHVTGPRKNYFLKTVLERIENKATLKSQAGT